MLFGIHSLGSNEHKEAACTGHCRREPKLAEVFLLVIVLRWASEPLCVLSSKAIHKH